MLLSNTAIASDINSEQLINKIDFSPADFTSVANLSGPISESIPPTNDTELDNFIDDAIEQVTSVSQLSDVQPTDWAFQALQSLVERYGCIEGYPDRTYRGNRAITRYEFAAGLNA
ncbi:MAG TPA: iron uptake porin, partial [Phormidium sp.]